MHYRRYYIPFLFLIGFLIRMVFISNPGFEADISFWKSWGLAPYDFGVIKGLPLTNFNYPTPFAYFLWAMTSLYSLFANPHNFNQFWSNINLPYLTVIKLPAILADLGIAAILLWFPSFVSSLGSNRRFSPPSFFKIFGNYQEKQVWDEDQRWGVLLASLYLFSPLSIFDSAWWGQVDSLGVFLFLVSVVFILQKKPFISGLIYMLALMTKLQNMIYGPLYALFVLQIIGWNGLVAFLGGSAVAFFGLNIEFLKAGVMDRVIYSLTGNYDYFPYLSLQSYNLWWIVAGGHGMALSDKMLTIGIVKAKTVGLVLFSFGYLIAILHLIKEQAFRSDTNEDGVSPLSISNLKSFFTSLVIVVSAFFFLQTESHDRYLFPAFVFALFWILLYVREHLTIKERTFFWTTKIFQNVITGYILFTVLYFLNLHTAFIANYPQNGVSLLLFLNAPFWTITIAILLIIGFLIFAFSNISVWYGGLFVFGALASILFLNLPLLRHQPISLTKLAPISYSQGWGAMNVNMSVNANSNNWKTWNRLSTQYYFYSKGIGTHANSTIIYDLNKLFTTFAVDYGVDTEADSQASVQFEIYGDDVLMFRSDIMKRFDTPKHTQVNVTGIAKLKLVVTDAGNGIQDDHADWLNPVLYP